MALTYDTLSKLPIAALCETILDDATSANDRINAAEMLHCRVIESKGAIPSGDKWLIVACCNARARSTGMEI